MVRCRMERVGYGGPCRASSRNEKYGGKDAWRMAEKIIIIFGGGQERERYGGKQVEVEE